MNSEESILIGTRESQAYYSSLDSTGEQQEQSPDCIQSVPSIHSTHSGYNTTSTFREELKTVITSSFSLSVSFFLQYFISVTAIYSAGRLGPAQLAAVQLAVSTFNITGNAIYQGIATSLDSLCSRAIGQKSFHDVGVFFQRCTCIMLVITIGPLACLWYNSGYLLSHLVSDPQLISQCQQYLRIITLGAPGLLLFESGKRFLLCQRLVNPITYILCITAIVNLACNYWLVWNPATSVGFIGIPISVVISYWTLPLITLLYVTTASANPLSSSSVSIDPLRCWGGLSVSASFHHWVPMLKLAIPGIIMVEAEYLAFQVLNFFAASLSTTALAAQSICSTIGSLIFQVNFSVSVLVSTRVGHYVGSRDFIGAHNVVRISLLLASVIGSTSFVVIYLARKWLASIFTDDSNLIVYASKLMVLLSVNQFADSFNVLCAGILRGQGRQKIGSILNLISYYVISIPLGYYLAFYHDLEVIGLWYGLVLGVMTLSGLEIIYVVTSDWPAIERDLQKKSSR